MPLFSIITINYNNAEGLRKTMQSVINQSSDNFEYIVVDGASTDGSIEVIKWTAQQHKKPFRYISEPDSGIYNAMNKGIKMSSGEFLLFLNSGDIFYDENVLASCAKAIDQKAELCSGVLTILDDKKEIILNPPKKIGLFQSVYQGLTHPNTFIKRSLFDKYGMYNEENKIVSDWEFFLVSGGLNECNYQSIDVIISKFMSDGISSNNKQLLEEEKQRVLNKHLSPKIKQELEERRISELKLEESAHSYIEKLKNNPHLFKMATHFLRRLGTVSRKIKK